MSTLLVSWRGLFQSTHPVWDATIREDARHRLPLISIHASRMGCDQTIDDYDAFVEFQSTHPVWDATRAH